MLLPANMKWYGQMNKPALIYTTTKIWHERTALCERYEIEADDYRQEVRRWRNQARVNWWEGLVVGLVIATALFLLSPATPSVQVGESLSHKTQSDTSRFSTTVKGAGEAHVMGSALPIGRRN